MIVDNKTGVLSNRQNKSNVAGYDLVWTKDNSKLVVGGIGLGHFIIDATTGTKTIINGPDLLMHSVEIGADGNYYFNGSDGLWRWTESGAATKVDNSTGTGLPTMYIPPAEEPDIEEVNPICDTSGIIDLNTYWICSSLSAEDTVDSNPNGEQRHFYQGTGITDDKIGIFDPSVAGVGIHKIIFTYCGVDDTIEIEVVRCKESNVTNIESSFNSNAQVKVYPNPTSQALTLELLDPSKTNIYRFELFSITGKSIITSGFSDNMIKTIDISYLSSGLYYIKIFDTHENIFNRLPIVIRK